MKYKNGLSLGLLCGLSFTLQANSTLYDQACIDQALEHADAQMTLQQLRQRCTLNPPLGHSQATPLDNNKAAQRRLKLESYSLRNPFSLTPHKPNYLLPVVYYNRNNPVPFEQKDNTTLDNIEAHFQLSLKFLIWADVFGSGGNLFGAYTNRSFWQAYNSDVSSPFRETNHEPELILSFTNDWTIFGFTNVLNQVSLNHQSNGRSTGLSRSWNRIIFTSAFERGNFAFAFSPWYRLPEDKKTDPTSSEGDDNPDIEDYLGHFNFTAAYTRQQNTFSLILRNNLSSENHGSMELSWSFPINHTFKGYVKYFDGYGESLIDYNEPVQSLGIGFLLSDWL